MCEIAGLHNFEKNKSIEGTFQLMLNAMKSVGKYETKSVYNRNKNIGGGIVHHSFSKNRDQPLLSKDHDDIIFLDCEDSDYHDFPNALLGVTESIKKNHCDLKNIEGSFSIAGFNFKNENKIWLAVDKFGLKPIYYTKNFSFFAFASEIKALLKVDGISKAINYNAIADVFRYGFVLGNKTLFEDIYLLEPGSILIYDIMKMSYQVNKYWALNDLFSPESNDLIKLDDVAQIFYDNFQNKLLNKNSCISLSGGLDSRAIIAAIGDKTREMKSYTVGLKGCYDHKLAKEISHKIGTNHTSVIINQNLLCDFKKTHLDVVSLSDGLYYSHEITESIVLDYLINYDVTNLIRGHGGELAKLSTAYSFSANRELLSQNFSRNDLLKILFKNLNQLKQIPDISKIFDNKLLYTLNNQEMLSLEDSFSGADPNLNSFDLLSYIFIKEYIRRQTVASLSIFRAKANIILPFLDERYLNLLFKLPAVERWSGQVHKKIIANFFPELAKISNSNTGAPINAGKVRTFISEKLLTIFKKYSIPGYRHYAEPRNLYSHNSRTEFKKILLDERTLSRGLYNPNMINMMFLEYSQNQNDYSNFFSTILLLELWFRTYIDDV